MAMIPMVLIFVGKIVTTSRLLKTQGDMHLLGR